MSDKEQVQPTSEQNTITNDSTQATTNEKDIPYDRFSEVVAKKNNYKDENTSLRKQLDEFEAKNKERKQQQLEEQGKFKEANEVLKQENQDLKVVADEYNSYKAKKRESLMETLSNQDDKDIAEGMDLTKLEKFVNRVNTASTVSTSSNRPATRDMEDLPKGGIFELPKEERKKHWASYIDSIKRKN